MSNISSQEQNNLPADEPVGGLESVAHFPKWGDQVLFTVSEISDRGDL